MSYYQCLVFIFQNDIYWFVLLSFKIKKKQHIKKIDIVFFDLNANLQKIDDKENETLRRLTQYFMKIICKSDSR